MDAENGAITTHFYLGYFDGATEEDTLGSGDVYYLDNKLWLVIHY